MTPLQERLVGNIRERLLLALGAVAFVLLIACANAYAMAQRTKEIGIRVALGAARHDVTRLVISQTLWPTLAGVAAGVGGALVATRVIASMLYGVTRLDAMTFAGTAFVLVAVPLMASCLPARRAARIDPLTALRCE